MSLGLISALPTFFTFHNKIDYKNMHNIIENQINQGIRSILIGGSTGELFLLQEEEYLDLLSYVFKNFSKKVNIIASVSSISTNGSLDLAKKILNIGIDKALCATPAYIKPNQTCIFEYFSKIAEQIKIILYSVPSRTGADISLDTICKLSHNNNIIGFKDAGPDVKRVGKIKQYLLQSKQELELFSGDDITYLGFCAQGGNSIISVISNLLPKEMVKIQTLIEQNNFTSAKEHFFQILSIIEALEQDANPIAIKYLMSQIDSNLNGACRPPLQCVEDQIKNYIQKNNIITLIKKFI